MEEDKEDGWPAEDGGVLHHRVHFEDRITDLPKQCCRPTMMHT